MNETILNSGIAEDIFTLARAELYQFAIIQVVIALMTATGAVLLGIFAKGSTTQRVSTTTKAVVSLLCFAVGYALLVRCPNRCTSLVRRISSGVFVLNNGIAERALAAQSNFYPLLTSGLSVAVRYRSAMGA
ncbi:hypothetical protein QCE62_19330 [Caballeronia sp. LZ033]|uniref:hypothetical protein n=1 Tax=Caballeronia sp. LZ033 TaxID=3038566 RepID=UPI00285DFE38|nr:hypothetical protein [Caballeronia sp. LZ033]MDR5815744.1 hypothetical protein [Caballeronia sp. LZ033]